MLCYKRQGNYEVCNEFPSGPVGWVVARGTVGLGSFGVRIRKVQILFLFRVSFLSFFLRVKLSVRVRIMVRFRVSVRVRIRVRVRF